MPKMQLIINCNFNHTLLLLYLPSPKSRGPDFFTYRVPSPEGLTSLLIESRVPRAWFLYLPSPESRGPDFFTYRIPSPEGLTSLLTESRVPSPESQPIQVPSPNTQASNYLLGCLRSKSRTVKKKLGAGRAVPSHRSRY
jgi:hypothetical protein